MLKMSGKTRILANTFMKLTVSLIIGCLVILSLIFMKYKLVYRVEINNEDVGYISSKVALEKKIDDFVINGNGGNVAYVTLNSRLKYELMLINKSTTTSDEEIFARVKDNSEVYHKVYAVYADEKEYLVSSLEDAQKIVDDVNKKQEEYKERVTLQIEERYAEERELQEVGIIDDIEVAVNEIYEPVKKANEAITQIKSTPAAVKTVSKEVLLALKESLADLKFSEPISNPVITSRFGWRSSGYHYGLDLAGPTGTPIYAAEAGVVTYADWLGAYGYLVKIQHAGGYETYYGHCSKIIAQVGDTVKKGDLIAEVGSTGRSSGPHVHLEIRHDGTPLNPEVFLYE